MPGTFGTGRSRNRPSSVGNGRLTSWYHHLNPELSKEKWSHEDNLKLFQLHKELGPRWKEIAAKFEKRTDNGIKNQFFSIIRKSLRKACKFCQLAIPPASINSIKPRILSEFLNSDLSQDQENATNQGQSGSIKISELVHRFAFNKNHDMDPNVKRLFRDLLEKNFQKLENLKWAHQQPLRRGKKEQENLEGKVPKTQKAALTQTPRGTTADRGLGRYWGGQLSPEPPEPDGHHGE